MELLGASEAENLTKQKWKQYCGTPCSYHSPHVFIDLVLQITIIVFTAADILYISGKILQGPLYFVQNFDTKHKGMNQRT